MQSLYHNAKRRVLKSPGSKLLQYHYFTLAHWSVLLSTVLCRPSRRCATRSHQEPLLNKKQSHCICWSFWVTLNRCLQGACWLSCKVTRHELLWQRSYRKGQVSLFFSLSNPAQKKTPYPSLVALPRVQAKSQALFWSRLATDLLYRKTEVTKSWSFPNSPKASRKAEKFTCISLEKTPSYSRSPRDT